MVEKQIRKRPEVESVTDKWKKFVNPGDDVSGWYQGRAEISIPNTESGEVHTLWEYCLVDEQGIKTKFLGTAQLNALLPRVPVDAFLVVTYEGTDRTMRGNTVKVFRVDLEKGITLLKGLDNGAQID